MIKAVLFDLDDTLLANDVYQTFIPAYFELLATYMARYMEPALFLKFLNACTQSVIKRIDPVLTNKDLFWTLFAEQSGRDRLEMETAYDRFCRDEFPKLASLTQRRPAALPLIKACFERSLKVVIATNPLFPSSVIEQRLAWAGVPVSNFHYDLVTSADNMHSTKPNPAYYSEILEKINCPPKAAMMVGDSWENDMIPAASLGIASYWLKGSESEPPDERMIIGRGTLDDFYGRFMNEQGKGFRRISV